MRRRRLRECLLGWLVFSFPFLALTAPAWMPVPWLAAMLMLLGLLIVIWLDVGYVVELVKRIKGHRDRDHVRH
jgi:hypothetical protein